MGNSIALMGGMVIDPSQGIYETRDIILADGVVSRIDEKSEPSSDSKQYDLSGKVVVPGLIDLHTHVYWGVSHYGIEADRHCLARGVTTVLDVGSAGSFTFPGFRRYVIDRSQTQIFAYLHVAGEGMISPDVGELEDIRWIDTERAVRMCEEHRDIIRGIKVRLTPSIVGENGRQALAKARRVADEARLPLMVHPNGSHVSIRNILKQMKPGDIVTHCFHGKKTGILDERKKLRAAVLEARERGVLFDVGHGKGSFSFEVARGALDQGFLPDTISSDLHTYSLPGPAVDLVTTMSKFLHMGLSLQEVVQKTTLAPSKALGAESELGTLRIGTVADVSVLEVIEGEFELDDCEGEKITAKQLLRPSMIVSKGSVVSPA
jgi:dihydroorotase